MKVHKGYVRRTFSLAGSALFLTMLGLLFLFGTVKGYMGGEALYKMGDIYRLKDAGTSVAIRVLDIDVDAVTYDGNDYYLVKHEKGVTPLQAQAKDIQQLLDLKKENPNGWEPLRDENIYLNVRVTPAVTKGRKGSTTFNIPAALIKEIMTQYQKGTLRNTISLDALHYLKLTSFTNRFFESVVTIIVILIAMLYFKWTYKRLRSLKEHYEVFDKEFPRYALNMKALPKDADFHDPMLKVLVKDHKLVCYNDDFSVIKLREVRNVEVRRQLAKSSVTYAFDFGFGQNKKVTVQLNNRPYNIRQLVEYLNEKEGTKISIPFQL